MLSILKIKISAKLPQDCTSIASVLSEEIITEALRNGGEMIIGDGKIEVLASIYGLDDPEPDDPEPPDVYE